GASPARAQSGGVINACYDTKNGQLRRVSDPTECKKTETALTWNLQGPPGATGATGKFAGSEPVGVAVNPAGTRGYVTNQASDDVSVIDTASNTVVATIKVGSNPTGSAFK